MKPALREGTGWPGGQPPRPECGARGGLVCSEARRQEPRAPLGSAALKKNLQAVKALAALPLAATPLPRGHDAPLAFLVQGGCAEPMAPAHGCS